MSMISLTLPASYGYVVGVGVASTMVNQWLGARVNAFRGRAKVEYPNAYASAADASKSIEKYQFNCAQRGHQNFLEQYSNFLVLLFTGGLSYPQASAGLGAVYLVGRILYAIGYTRPVRDGGKGRYRGALQYLGMFGLYGLAFTSVYKMIV